MLFLWFAKDSNHLLVLVPRFFAFSLYTSKRKGSLLLLWFIYHLHYPPGGGTVSTLLMLVAGLVMLVGRGMILAELPRIYFRRKLNKFCTWHHHLAGTLEFEVPIYAKFTWLLSL